MRSNTILGERTIKNYVNVMRSFLANNDVVTVEGMNAFVSRCQREVRRYYVKYAFMHYLKFIGREDIYKDVIKVKERPNKTSGNYITPDEMLDIISNISIVKYKAVALIQFLTGSRAGDILRFNINDLMLEDDGTLKMRLFTKGDKEHIVFIPIKYADTLYQYMLSTNSTYPFLQGESDDFIKWTDNNYRYYWEALHEAAKSKGRFTTHDFRRNFANDILEATSDPRIAQKLLGHGSLEYTIRYFNKVVDESKVKIIADQIRG